MKAALAQMDIIWEEKEKNEKKAEDMIKEAKKERADFILFPEMSLTGFSMNVQKIGEEKKNRNVYSSIERMSRLSKKYQIALGFGYVEKSGIRGKNHYVVLGKDGQILSDYVKIHPFSYGGENQYYDSGDKIIRFKLKNLNFGVFICYDLRFPEIFCRSCEKTEVFIVAANWPERRREHWMTLLRARAIENQCYVLGVNRTGTGGGIRYVGDSMAVDPYGNVIDCLREKEGIVFCKIDAETVKDWREQFPQRKDRKKDYSVFLEKNDRKRESD